MLFSGMEEETLTWCQERQTCVFLSSAYKLSSGRTQITYHATIGERRRENEHVIYTKPVRRQNGLRLQHKSCAQ